MPDDLLTDAEITKITLYSSEEYERSKGEFEHVRRLLADRVEIKIIATENAEEVKRLQGELERDQCPKCKVDGYWHKACKMQEQWNSDKASTIANLRKWLESSVALCSLHTPQTFIDKIASVLAETKPPE